MRRSMKNHCTATLSCSTLQRTEAEDRALLRNSFSRNEVEAEFTGLSSESHSFPVLNAAAPALERR